MQRPQIQTLVNTYLTILQSDLKTKRIINIFLPQTLFDLLSANAFLQDLIIV